MDPNETLKLLIDEAVEGRGPYGDKIRQIADDLANWIERGGFRPADPRHTVEEG